LPDVTGGPPPEGPAADPREAVAVLMIMHLAIALITYNCLVHLAKVSAMSRPAPETVPRHDALRGATRHSDD
jgi:hypothetical protein